MKLTPSNKVLAVLFLGILIFSMVNTYLIANYNSKLENRNIEQDNKQRQDVSDLNQALNQTSLNLSQTDAELRQNMQDMQNLLDGNLENIENRLPIEQYDYIICREWDNINNISIYFAKNGENGSTDFSSSNASFVFNEVLKKGNSVYVKADEYSIYSDISLENKKNARLDSDGATLALNGHKITIRGESYQTSQNNQISGLIIINGTIRIENSFRSSIINMIFANSTVAIELANTNTWTEGTRIDTVHFDKCIQSIVFRTNTSDPVFGYNSTGSYGNTEIRRTYFNLMDNSVAITVEQNAEFTDGQMQNIRIWIGEFSNYNQTGLLLNVNSSMYQTLLDGVVFESFAKGDLQNAMLYAIRIDLTVYGTPILQSGVSFLGKWTARINNSYYNWISGGGSVFKQQNVTVPVDRFDYSGEPVVVQMSPSTISSFKPKFAIQGSFQQNETVTIRIRLEFVDNTVSGSVEKNFTNSSVLWLSDDDLMQLFPSQNIIYAILIDAKVNSAGSDAKVQFDLYGQTT
jgi:hypothetical protein